MFCRYCGQKIVDDSIFCCSCGKKLIFPGVEVEIEEETDSDRPFESDPEFVWDLREFPEQKGTEDVDFKWEEGLELELELEQDQTFAPAQDEKIDKFYTFCQKNEEFQKLLDKEYEKVKNNDLSIEETEPEEDTTAANLIFDNDTLSKRFDTKEFNKDLIESALEKAGVILTNDNEPESEKDSYESDFKPRFIVDTGEEDEIKEAHEPGEVFEFVATDDIAESILPAVDPKKQEAFKALEELWGAHGSNKIETVAIDKPAEPEQQTEPEKTAEEQYPTREESFSVNEKTKNSGVGKAVLIILILLLCIEIVILGIVNIIPDSGAASFIKEKMSFTIMFFDKNNNAGEPAEVN